jgi:hypothetical protein
VVTAVFVSVLCRGRLGAGSLLVSTGNSSDRVGTERMKVKEGQLGRGEDWGANKGE